MNRPQHVFLITNGPHAVWKDGDGKEYTNCIPTSELFKQSHHIDGLVKFWFMPGWLCPDVRDAQGRFEIWPQLDAPIPINVKVIDLCGELEHGNPQGVALLAEVKEVSRYQVRLSQEDCRTPILKPGDIIRISYHLLQTTGGFSILLHSDNPLLEECRAVRLTDVAPMVNSLSQLCREYIGKSDPQQRDTGGTAKPVSAPRRDYDVYKVVSTSAQLPVGHNLSLDVTREV